MPGFRRATDLLHLNGLIIWQFYTTLYNINQLAILYNFVKHLCFTDTFMVIRMGILLCVIFCYYFLHFSSAKRILNCLPNTSFLYFYIQEKGENLIFKRKGRGYKRKKMWENKPTLYNRKLIMYSCMEPYNNTYKML